MKTRCMNKQNCFHPNVAKTNFDFLADITITPHRISVLFTITLQLHSQYLGLGRTYATLYDCIHLPTCMYASLQLKHDIIAATMINTRNVPVM